MAKKKSERQKAEDRLWFWFSKFIRLRDCIRTTGDIYGGRCISCGEYVPFKEGDCGHWLSRMIKTTKYHEKNNHLQCKRCNKWLSGNAAEYALALNNLYGIELLQELEELKIMFKSGRYKPLASSEMRLMGKHYKKAYEMLLQNG